MHYYNEDPNSAYNDRGSIPTNNWVSTLNDSDVMVKEKPANPVSTIFSNILKNKKKKKMFHRTNGFEPNTEEKQIIERSSNETGIPFYKTMLGGIKEFHDLDSENLK